MALKSNEQAIINLVINGQAAQASLRELTGTYNALYAEVTKLKKADDPALYDEKVKKLQMLKDARDAEKASIISSGVAEKQFQDQFKTGMQEMQTNTSKFREGLEQVKSSLETLGLSLGIAELISFGKELFALESKADGIHNAFAKIGNTEGLIEKLREASRGLIADLDLEKIAVKANNANIPIEKMGLFLRFAQQRARETGEDVTALTEKIIEGLGRGTPKALAGLGVSVVEIKEEFKRTGDMVEAVSNIINRQMAKSGQDVENFGDITEQTKTKWENFKDTLAGWFKDMLTPQLADNELVAKSTDLQLEKFKNFRKMSKEQLQGAIEEQQTIMSYYKEDYDKAQAAFKELDSHTGFKRLGDTMSQDADKIKLAAKTTSEAYQGARNALAALNKEQEKRTVKTEVSDDKKPEENRKLEEYKKQLEEVKAAADVLAVSAGKGTLDDLDAQLKVIDDKYQKVVMKIKGLLKDPHTSDAIRSQLNALIGALDINDKQEQEKFKTEFAKKQQEAAKKDNEESLKNTSSRINNVYDTAKGELTDAENTDLNAVKEVDPRIAAQLRLNIQGEYAKKRYQLEKQNLEDLKEINQAYGKDTGEIDKKIADITIKENERAAKKKEEDDKKYVQAKKEIENLEMDNLQGGADLLLSVLNKKSDMYKAALIVDKAIAIARIEMNTEEAISAFTAANIGIPIAGPGLVLAYTIAARINEGLQILGVVKAAADGLSGAKAEKGGYFEGSSHDEGGLDVFDRKSGKHVVNVEGGEPFMVLSKETRKNNGPLINQLLHNSLYRNGATVDINGVSRGIQAAKNGGVFESDSSNGTSFTHQAQSGGKADNSRLDRMEAIMHDFIEKQAAINEKPVTFNNRVYDTQKNKNVQIKNNANA